VRWLNHAAFSPNHAGWRAGTPPAEVSVVVHGDPLFGDPLFGRRTGERLAN
jgi:hypothetical protein